MALLLFDIAPARNPNELLVIVAVVVIVIAVVSVVAAATGIFIFLRLRKTQAGAVREPWAASPESEPDQRSVPIDLPNKLT